MKQFIILSSVFLLLLAGCSEEKPKVIVSSEYIKELALDALSGEETANKMLSSVFDPSLPGNLSFNKLIVDSLETELGKFYLLLGTYPNPLYNRLAIYDTDLNLLLVDRSLNGNVFLESRKFRTFGMLAAIEEFISKDVIHLRRVSIYYLTSSKATLALRTFTKLVSPDRYAEQRIESISSQFVYTELEVNPPAADIAEADTFYYDDSINKFASDNYYFDGLVSDIVAFYEAGEEMESIADTVTASASLQKDHKPRRSKTRMHNFSYDKIHFHLPGEWENFDNRLITSHLKKPLAGSLFTNDELGTRMFVIRLREDENAESYAELPLLLSAPHRYQLRYSEAEETGGDIIRYYEIECSTLKYLVVFEVDPDAYVNSRYVFEYIIKSIGVDC